MAAEQRIPSGRGGEDTPTYHTAASWVTMATVALLNSAER